MSQRDSYGKEDIRHIEEIPHSEKDTVSSPDEQFVYPTGRTEATSRWGRFRQYFAEPPIPAGQFITRYPNRWSRYREIIREPAAEFVGMFVLMIFGLGNNCQVTLSTNTGVASSPKGEYISTTLGWAAAVACGVWVSGGISGGHINPAVTIAFATMRDFPWRKVPAFLLAQFLGAFVAAAIIYGNYLGAIDIVEGGGARTISGTAGLFATYPLDYVTNIRAFFDEFLGTAMLLIVVCAVTDNNNGPPPPGLVPLCLFFTLVAIGSALGMQTGYAINPARDFGPRTFTAMAGYGRAVYNFRHQYWLWCPVIAPICGGIVGVFFYDLFLYLGSESILNRPDKRARRVHAHAMAAERTKPGITGPELV